MHHPALIDVIAACARLRGHVVRTPLPPSPTLHKSCGHEVLLKLESRQTTGSFKLRGATNAVLMLDPGAATRGVIAASTGNHARALAYAARAQGLRCVVCMSELVPANKVDAVRALGADVRIVGQSQDDAQHEVDRLVVQDGLSPVPPFDDARVIAGQGTIAVEILEARPDTATLVVPLSGGGLAGGIAMAAKALQPSIRVVGVSMTRGAAMHASLAAGGPVEVRELPTLADSLGGGIGLANRHTFELVRAGLDEVVLLSEAEIADGIRHAYLHEQEIVEGAGAVGIAAVLAGRVRSAGPIAIVVSGRNIDMTRHLRIVTDETSRDEYPGADGILS
ncbi:hydroxyectoine utilization dehydratase EutB [Gluconacetobacter azotocaptans]|uniref:Hydroxyectoine utilization dehydratase EutB n=1 Tax=Gluconacetobacter azotocaptans TaxID=142834 RepID=A0A7W4PCS3_9PROT|nr:hydroxyectoine utilization dehydratase EutB [Gluconacetobacter azotocaptans]MBB2188925.1 hydroxyectoine utilization dehydratase EutB [Gluconacetobacter azotocaptans]MBM9401503.1 hydroxyectoine utilization dehydratase EutB [Gluconacetobacter azotocaptans]GBQ25996.1 threonine dehydratase [Gluconacetobacter azotocaptans DSM 13594]